MNTRPHYKKTYDDSRLSDAYHMYVDGVAASQRNLHTLTGISERTIARRSKEDGWNEERSEREKAVAGSIAAAVVAAAAAPATSVPDVSQAIADALVSGDVKLIITTVLQGQQRFCDLIFQHLHDGLAREVAKSLLKGEPVRIQLLAPYIHFGEKVAAMQRKAHGIPDVMKFEIEDKSTAQKHAEKIEERRRERLAHSAAAMGVSVPAGSDSHGPN